MDKQLNTTQATADLTNYTCIRACFAWLMATFALFFAVKHYGLLDGLAATNPSDGYLQGVFDRFLKSRFYQAMGVSLVGFSGYGLAMLIAVRRLETRLYQKVRGKKKVKFTWFGSLVGLPRSLVISDDGWRLFIRRGANYATAPLRDAATLFPAVGFLGTVIGVSIAIGGLDKVLKSGDTNDLMQGLRTAFDTTFMGLCAALVLTVLIFAIDASVNQIKALTERLPPTDGAPEKRLVKDVVPNGDPIKAQHSAQ